MPRGAIRPILEQVAKKVKILKYENNDLQTRWLLDRTNRCNMFNFDILSPSTCIRCNMFNFDILSPSTCIRCNMLNFDILSPSTCIRCNMFNFDILSPSTCISYRFCKCCVDSYISAINFSRKGCRCLSNYLEDGDDPAGFYGLWRSDINELSYGVVF